MKYLLLVFGLTTSIIFSADGQVIVTDKEFIGIKVGQTTFEKADSLLKRISFKETEKYYRHIRWSGGGGSMFYAPQYFIKIGKSKLKVVVMGLDDTISQIQIFLLKKGKHIKYKNVILGQTKVKDIQGLKNGDWDEGEVFNDILLLEYETVDIGVSYKSKELIENREIKYIALTSRQKSD